MAILRSIWRQSFIVQACTQSWCFFAAMVHELRKRNSMVCVCISAGGECEMMRSEPTACAWDVEVCIRFGDRHQCRCRAFSNDGSEMWCEAMNEPTPKPKVLTPPRPETKCFIGSSNTELKSQAAVHKDCAACLPLPVTKTARFSAPGSSCRTERSASVTIRARVTSTLLMEESNTFSTSSLPRSTSMLKSTYCCSFWKRKRPMTRPWRRRRAIEGPAVFGRGLLPSDDARRAGLQAARGLFLAGAGKRWAVAAKASAPVATIVGAHEFALVCVGLLARSLGKGKHWQGGRREWRCPAGCRERAAAGLSSETSETSTSSRTVPANRLMCPLPSTCEVPQLARVVAQASGRTISSMSSRSVAACGTRASSR